MQYLSSFRSVTGVVEPCLRGTAVIFSESQIELTDTDTGLVEQKCLLCCSMRNKSILFAKGRPLSKLFKTDKILGMYVSSDNKRHSCFKSLYPEDIKFHSFVQAEASVGVDFYSVDEADLATTVGTGCRFRDGADELVVLITDETVEVAGLLGSVCCITRGVGTYGRHTFCDILSLRELVLYLCRRCRRSIMQYSKVRVVSCGAVDIEGEYLQTELRFKHSAESDRYFTKLLLMGSG